MLIMLTVPDPDATAAQMVRRGGELVIPVENRPYGRRQGRVRDPFGHLWVLGGEPRWTFAFRSSAASAIPGESVVPPGGALDQGGVDVYSKQWLIEAVSPGCSGSNRPGTRRSSADPPPCVRLAGYIGRQSDRDGGERVVGDGGVLHQTG
ncbi:VOC family protein [Nocardia farcinica]|uniref:VOC family protein n=1 Tax=Nocardia farcinica TaxID=37329 RepID=UPI001E64B7F0|nr:VOC family protein [Nocardia farcinica]